MTRNKAILLGLFTTWPFIMLGIGWLFEATGLLTSATGQPPPAFVVLYAMLCLAPFGALALLVFYLAYLLTRPQLPLDRKLVWAAVLLIGHVYVMPVIWYLHVWKPRSYVPLRVNSQFSLLVFGPLLLGLLLPFSVVLPVALASVVALDPSGEPVTAGPIISLAWVAGPILGALIIFLIGRLCAAWFLHSDRRWTAWVLLWIIFAVLSLPVVVYDTFVLRNLLPSDGPPNTLPALAGAGLILWVFTLPVVVAWLFGVSRLLPRLRPH